MTAAHLITEKELLRTVVELAHTFGWLVYHQVDMGHRDDAGRVHYSRRIGPGFPDLVLCQPVTGRLIFAELKAQNGHISGPQQEWLYALENSKSSVTYLWKPSDLPDIEKILAGDGIA